VLKISPSALFPEHFLGYHFTKILLSGHFLQKFRLRCRLMFNFCSHACPGGPKKQAARGPRTPAKTLIRPWWEVPLGNFKILSEQKFLKYKIAEENSNQICSTMKFVEQNWLKCDFALFSTQDLRVKLRSFSVLFKKFHPRIDLTTLFLTKLYLVNTINPFSGHKNDKNRSL
jgi:hypothetical protein